MKSKFSSLILLLLPICLLSQEVPEEENNKSNKEHVGVKLDLGISGFRNNLNDVENNTHYENLIAPTMNIGVFYSYELSNKLTLGLEAAYSHILHKFEFDYYSTSNFTDKATVQIRTSYFTFPIYVGYKFDKLSVNAGMRIGLELSNRVITSGGDDIGTYHTTISFKEYDFGPRLGFLYEVSEKVGVELLYYQGLQNLVDYDTGDFDLYFNTWQLTAGVRYALK